MYVPAASGMLVQIFRLTFNKKLCCKVSKNSKHHLIVKTVNHKKMI